LPPDSRPGYGAPDASTRRFRRSYGGEEFGIVLPNTASAAAAIVLQGVLESVRKLAITHSFSKVSREVVTVSIGFASLIPGKNDLLADFLRRADDALYEAKEAGRDRTAFGR